METRKNVILVTGANGLTGREIVRSLSAKGVSVRILVRDINKAKSLLFDTLPNVTIFKGDMARSDTLSSSLYDTDKVMLISSSNADMEFVQSNFIIAAKKSGVSHIVKLSGIIADRNSPFRFARMHAEIEKILELSGIAYTHLRAGEFMQSYFRQASNIIKKDSLILPMENQKIASVDVSDIAEVAVKVLTGTGHEGKIYPVTGPDALTMHEVAEIFSTVLKRKINYINISPAEAKRAQLDAGFPQYTADALAELFAERRKGKEAQVYPTIQNVFGLNPTGFKEFVIKYLQVFTGKTEIR
jgi:uncharacterized protein YbjT (DUF2867 family)